MFSRLGSRPPRIIIRSTYRGFPTTSNTFTGLTRTYASDSSAFTPPRRVSRSQKYLRRTLLTLFGIGVAYVVDRELHASAINRNIRTAWTVSALHVQCLIARRVSFSLSCVRGRVSVRTHGLALLHAACAIPFFLYTRPLPSSRCLKQLVRAANAFPHIYSADMTSPVSECPKRSADLAPFVLTFARSNNNRLVPCSSYSYGAWQAPRAEKTHTECHRVPA